MLNRFELFHAMLTRTPINVRGMYGLINGIEMEDGSGHNFIIHVCVCFITYKVYVRA